MAAATRIWSAVRNFPPREKIPMPVLAAAPPCINLRCAGPRRQGQGRHDLPAGRGAGRAIPRAGKQGHTMTDDTGIRRGLTNYGDKEFAQYLRNSFAPLHGPVAGHARQADCRHRHDALGLQQLPPQHARTCGCGCIARRFGRRRAAKAVSHRSLGEVFLNPTSMVYRNLMAMDTEEMIRARRWMRWVLHRRLRQDRASPIDGRAVGEYSRRSTRHRPDVHRPAIAASGLAPAPTAGASGRNIARARWMMRKLLRWKAGLPPPPAPVR